MKYSEHYNQYYNRIYSIVEFNIKKYFIDSKKKKLNYGHCYNDLLKIIDKYSKNRITEKNTDIKALYGIFTSRLLKYSEDEIDCIIENDILIKFQKINIFELSKTNSIYKLMNEFALNDVLKEITRLLQNNSRLFELFYDLNEFDQFEIKYYRLQRLEDTEIFNNLNKRKNPHLYKKNLEIKSENLTEKYIPENLDATEKTILIDLIFSKGNWFSFSTRKKAKIISLIIGKNHDNIRNTLEKLEKKPSQLTNDFIKKTKEIEDKYDKLG
jgi:hypothetical protein